MNRSARLAGSTPENALDDIARPFAGDLLGRARLSDRLTTYIDRLREGAVIAIDASWGEGKTWFARNWAASLRRQDHPVIYLDTFRQNDELDPFFISPPNWRFRSTTDREPATPSVAKRRA